MSLSWHIYNATSLLEKTPETLLSGYFVQTSLFLQHAFKEYVQGFFFEDLDLVESISFCLHYEVLVKASLPVAILMTLRADIHKVTIYNYIRMISLNFGKSNIWLIRN